MLFLAINFLACATNTIVTYYTERYLEFN